MTAGERPWYAYNATRQSFVNLGVKVADTWWSRLQGMLGKIRIRAGEGVWLVPSRAIHTFGLRSPVDVIYLDADLRVVHLVECLVPLRIGPLRLRCESVLALPWRSIHESGTEIGDQFWICTPQIMGGYWNSPDGDDSNPKVTNISAGESRRGHRTRALNKSL
jgi:uncharacterized protein